jgi:hypothetical protein
MLRSNYSPPSSGSGSKPSKETTCKQSCRLIAGFLPGLHSDLEDGIDVFLRNVGDFYRTTQFYNPEDRRFLGCDAVLFERQLPFYLEDGGSTVYQNVGRHLSDYNGSNPEQSNLHNYRHENLESGLLTINY